MIRRLLPITLILALLSATIPAPALAVSTASEIEMGKAADDDIVRSSVVETDPLLNKWVNGIAESLFNQTARHDVPYNVKIIDDSNINAFSTMGGYLYVEEGLLDFAQSDDELAAVIGHETGHIERRHVLTMQAKANGLNLLFGILSLFSPFIYHFGNIMQAGLLAKMSRVDELQADQYGLLLMSRAGYDPEAMVSFMQHLGSLDKERPDLVTKYLQDHPEPDKRVNHLMGYAQLDPKVVTLQDQVVEATHDFESARYNVSAMKFQRILQKDPQNSIALLDLGQAQLALGQTSKSEQTLAQAAQVGTPQTRTIALAGIAGLREMERKRTMLLQPNLNPLRTQLEETQQNLQRASTEIGTRRDNARDQIRALRNRLDSISYEAQAFSQLNIRPMSRLEAVYKNFQGMVRSVDEALDKTQVVVTTTGSLEHNKEGGVLKDSQDIVHELQAPLTQSPMAPDSLALLPSYARMMADIDAANGDLIRANDASRASLAMLDVGLGDLDEFLRQFVRSQPDAFGDISTADYNVLLPLMQKADASLARAAVASSQAGQLYNMARSRQLQTRITMLGLGNSPQRYATLEKALRLRVGDSGIGYSQMLHQGLTPGEISAAAIVAADTKATTQDILQEARSTHRSIVDVANNRGMHSQALEIFLGLVYLDYTDDPSKESGQNSALNGTHSVQLPPRCRVNSAYGS